MKKLVSNLFAKAALVAMSAAVLSACDSDDGGTTTPDKNVTKEYKDIKLSSMNSLHSVTGDVTGTAMLKIVDDKTLEYDITLSGITAGDTLTAAHIHMGAVNETGGVVITLASAKTDFTGSTLKGSVALSTAEVTAVKSNGMMHYVNVHSTKNPNGIARASGNGRSLQAYQKN